MKRIRTRVISMMIAAVMLISLLLPMGILQAIAVEQVQIVQDFENGTENISAWMVDSNATWSEGKASPLSGKSSLFMSSVNSSGCYITFPAAVGVKNLGLRIKTTGTVGILRIGANGNDAHNKRADSATGYEELTTENFVFTNTEGTVLTNVASYDTAWGGLRFNQEFDGYIFIPNDNNIDIQKINIGIFHGSTNASGFSMLIDNFVTYSSNDYAAIVAEISELASPAVASLVEDFENGVSSVSPWMVDNNATWSEEKDAPLSGKSSLFMSSVNGSGCYITFPAAVGVKNLGLRIKTTGTAGILRIGANGNDAHNKRADSETGYEELTTENFVFTNAEGTVLTDVASYDTAWGGLRFNQEFDGYIFIPNDNNIDIQKINIGIYHGSTNASGFSILIDNFVTYNGEDYAEIASAVNEMVSPAPVILIQDFENGATGFTNWMVDTNATWGIDVTQPLSQKASLKMSTSNQAGCYVNIPAAVGKESIGVRLKISGTVGIVRIVANGEHAHELSTCQELTTSQFVFLDTNGEVLTDVASYDTAWGGLRFSQEFDGYVLISNENNVDIQRINIGIYHGSTNSSGYTMWLDNFFKVKTDNYQEIAGSFEGPSLSALAEKIQDFESGTTGFTNWMVDANATWSLKKSGCLCGTTSLVMSTKNGAGAYVTFPATVGKTNIGLRIQNIGINGVVRIVANGDYAHEQSTFQELTTTNFVFTDLEGNTVDNVASYDSDWGGLRFNQDFNGYLFISNDNDIDIQKINLGIFHGSTNANGLTLRVDNVFSFGPSEYARILEIIDEEPVLTSDGVLENFENGVKGFSAYLVDNNAVWKLEKKQPLAGSASLKLSTANTAGCYVTFPAIGGAANLAMRVKTVGDKAIIRIGANGNDAHYTSSQSTTGYYELTTEEFVFTDLNGTVLEDAGYYDSDWGGFRFNDAFDGYMFLKNTNNINIQKINVGIYHGSTDSTGYTIYFDNFTAYEDHSAENFAEIAAQLNQDVPAPADSSVSGGATGIPPATRDDLITDAFEDDTLDIEKWNGSATLTNGAAQITSDGITSIYGQKATSEKPAYFSAVFGSISNGAGLGLYSDDTHYVKVYYSDNTWRYSACAGGNVISKDLKDASFKAGDTVGIMYDGTQTIIYINNQKIDTVILPEGWDAERQYKVKLYGEATVNEIYVAGGVFTYTGIDEGMSDTFDGDLDTDKWNTVSIGYIQGDGSIGYPGTLTPECKDGRLVISGEPDKASNSYWAGISVITAQTQSPTQANPISFEVDRISTVFQEMNPPAVASGIGIYADENNFFEFVLNSWAPSKWQWAGMIDGIRFAGEVHSSGSSSTTTYHFKLVYDGKEVQCYVDGYLVATVKFDIGGADVHGLLLASPSNPAMSPCGVTVTYDNFVTTGLVANAPSTAEKQAESIKEIAQPTRRATNVSIPKVAAGFTATLVGIQPAGYVDSDGKILKRSNDEDITITAKVRVYDERNSRFAVTDTMSFVLLKAYSPTIVQDELAAGELPNQILGGQVIKGLQNPFIDETRLRLPQVAYVWTSPDNDLYCPELPDGFTAELIQSSNQNIIALDGTITPPDKESKVTVKLKISQNGTNRSDTRAYTVTVPARSGHAEWDTYKDNKVGMFLHYTNGQYYNDGTTADDADEMAEGFDTKGVVESAIKWHVDYIQVTAWHGDLITLYPSAVQQKYGMSRYTQRDVIGDLLDEIDAANKENGTNLELYLYTHPGQGVALHAIDQARVGWGDYDKYNTYISELYYELVSRYTNRSNGKQGISGLFFDEGSPNGDMDLYIDYPRLRDACKRAYTDLVMIQNLYQGNLYSQDVANHEVWPKAGTPYSSSFKTTNVDMWEASDNGGYSIVLSGNWWPTSAVSDQNCVAGQFTLSNMFRYTVLLASLNEGGGGVAWSFGNYVQSESSTVLWETGIDEIMTQFAEYYDRYNESLFETVPGKAYVTANASGVSSLKRVSMASDNKWGVSTDSKDGKTTYLHVLFAPSGNVLDLAAPANGVTFSEAELVGAEGNVKIEKLASGGYRLTLPEVFKWDSIDTVIALKVGSDKELDVVSDVNDGKMDFENNTVILKDGKAYIMEGTTYAQMKAYLEKDGKYIANFLTPDGIDEIDDTSDLWNIAASQGMILRLFASDYSDLTDYVITVVKQENNSQPVVPDTGVSFKWLMCLVPVAVSSVLILSVFWKKRRSILTNH